METKTNWIALVVCVLVGMGLGFLWYGVLFTDQWMSGNGITMQGETMMKNGAEMPMSSMPMIVNVVTLLVWAYLLNWLISKTNSWSLQGGATIGGVIGLFALFGIYTGNRYAGNPVSLSMVDGFYNVIILVVLGGIIGAWKSK